MTARKMLSLDMLLARLGEHRRCLDRIIFSNGCFDLFHAGHLVTLEAARLLGDVLVVAVNSDASVRRLKRPGRAGMKRELGNDGDRSPSLSKWCNSL